MKCTPVWALIVLLSCTGPAAAAENQVAVGYGKEFRGNSAIEQFEAFWRHQLPYGATLDGDAQVMTMLESAAAVLRERDSETNASSTVRFCLMPQVVFAASKNFRLFAGFGAGLMAGETEFDDHNLGGPFFLASKLGAQLLITDHLAIEYSFYHQSNAGIYDYNASLNMHHVSVAWRF